MSGYTTPMAQPQKPTHRLGMWAVAASAIFLAPLAVVLLTSVLKEPNAAPGRESAREAAVSGGDYLVRHLHSTSGTYDYLVDARTGATSATYNLLRHAGTTYALLTLYGETRDERYRSAAEHAIAFLLAQEKPCPPPHARLRCPFETDSVKLGGNALAVLALTEHVRVAGTSTYLAVAQAYAAWLIATQAPSGEFAVHKQFADGTLDNLVSSYYPGEAIFALMRLYALDGDERWRAGAERGARWLITVRDAGRRIEELEHDHWLLYGLAELYAQKPDELYLVHTRKLTDAILAFQHATPADHAWRGGFYNPPRSTPTATRVEGLMSAYTLFTRAGDSVYAARALEGVRRGVGFLLQTQVTRERRERDSLSIKALGGFTGRLDDTKIRIDYVQHSISALLGYAGGK